MCQKHYAFAVAFFSIFHEYVFEIWYKYFYAFVVQKIFFFLIIWKCREGKEKE
jgi:hypothetical protein